VRTYAAEFAGDARAASVAPKLVELLDDENVDVRVRSAQALLVLAQPTADPDDLAVLPDARESVYEHLAARAREALQRRRAKFEELKTPEQCVTWQQVRREFFVEQLGGFPERTPLEAQVVDELNGGDYRVEKVIYQSRPNHHVTAVVYLPNSKEFRPPYPAVLIACGHSKTGKAAEYNQRLGILLAKNGMAAMCYDPIGQGERSQILTDEGKPKYSSSTTEHFLAGVGAILTGTNTAGYRVWDGIRGIDYLCSRKDVNPQRIGCTGCSGGGTLTSYIMALDDRVTCAAPACYLTTLGRLLDTIGPQDAEQNIFAQVAFGMEQTDYVLMRAPKPTLICSTTGDFFDIGGTWDTFRQAKRFYAVLGEPEQVDLVETAGGHGVTQVGRETIVHWMRRWLLDDDRDVKDPGFRVWTVEELQSTPRGEVLLLDGARSVYDLSAEQAERFEQDRKQFAEMPPQAARMTVRRVAGIRPLDKLPRATLRSLGSVSRDGFQVRKLALDVAPGLSLPVLRFVPNEPNGNRTLYLHGSGNQAAADSEDVSKLVRDGQEVWSVDLRGIGELRSKSASNQLGDWKTFYAAYLLGESFVGQRAEDILISARLMTDGASEDAKIDLVATGEAAIPALHAAAVEPQLFGSVQFPEEMKSWADIAGDSEPAGQLTGTVHGALRYYDLPQLHRLTGR
jgi:cephalosporin-C deacetylase-like acetyl esterase